MSSLVSKTIGRFLVPNLEKDLAKAVNDGLKSSARLTDCFLPPVVYGFEKRAPTTCGIGHASSALERRIASASAPAPVFEKVHYRPLPKGLFR